MFWFFTTIGFGIEVQVRPAVVRPANVSYRQSNGHDGVVSSSVTQRRNDGRVWNSEKDDFGQIEWGWSVLHLHVLVASIRIVRDQSKVLIDVQIPHCFKEASMGLDCCMKT